MPKQGDYIYCVNKYLYYLLPPLLLELPLLLLVPELPLDGEEEDLPTLGDEPLEPPDGLLTAGDELL